MENDIKLLVCCHKPFVVPKSELYLPIHVGSSVSEINLGIQMDNSIDGKECENISSLNAFYCEMTAMYWAWKHVREIYPNIRYVGLCHYRRYFRTTTDYIKDYFINIKAKTKIILKLVFGSVVETTCIDYFLTIKSLSDERFLNDQEILRKLIVDNDILYTKPVVYMNCNVSEGFSIIGNKYLSLLNDIIVSEYKEYADAFNKVMKGKELPAANMIILKIDYLDEYASFVFDVLNKHVIKLKNEGILCAPLDEGIYNRVPGYLSELLTATYIYHKKGKVKTKELGKFFLEI